MTGAVRARLNTTDGGFRSCHGFEGQMDVVQLIQVRK
jgi:hypothetical protein